MEYIQGVSSQTRLFGWSLLLGLALGLLYCVFRFVRYLFGNKTAVCFCADTLYFIFCGVSVLFFNLVADDGKLRLYTVTGVLLGAFAFYLVSAKLSILLCRLSVRVIRVIFLLVKAPIKFFIRKISAALKKIRTFSQKRKKKTLKKSKNLLQNL